MSRRIAGVLLALLLVACGEERPEPHEDLVVPGDPNATASNAVERVMADALAEELDDGKLEDLLALHRRVLSQGTDVRGAMAEAGNWPRYGRMMMKWKAMQEAVDGGVDDLQRQLNAFQGNEAMRSLLEKQLKTLQALDTPETKALVAKWKPRFDALEEELDR